LACCWPVGTGSAPSGSLSCDCGCAPGCCGCSGCLRSSSLDLRSSSLDSCVRSYCSNPSRLCPRAVVVKEVMVATLRRTGSGRATTS
jgi:hypothetical protein